MKVIVVIKAFLYVLSLQLKLRKHLYDVSFSLRQQTDALFLLTRLFSNDVKFSDHQDNTQPFLKMKRETYKATSFLNLSFVRGGDRTLDRRREDYI